MSPISPHLVSNATNHSWVCSRNLVFTQCLRFIAASFLLAVAPVSVEQAGAADIIFGSGEGANPSPNGLRDSNWKIAGVPTFWTPPDSQTAPYDAYVLGLIAWNWGYAGERQWGISGAWNNALQTGFANSGGTSYWIAASSTGESLSGGGFSYSWVASQTFTITVSDTYQFDFFGAADDTMEFYVGGTLEYPDANNVTIVGGTKIGDTISGYVTATQVTGSVFLTAGEHTAYMRLTDLSGFTGAMIGRSSFAVVPEPSAYALGVVATVFLAIARWRGQRSITVRYVRAR